MGSCSPPFMAEVAKALGERYEYCLGRTPAPRCRARARLSRAPSRRGLAGPGWPVPRPRRGPGAARSAKETEHEAHRHRRYRTDRLAGGPEATAAGHQAVPAALSTGLDLITGKGLDQALEGAEVVVNVANSPTFDEASLGFFRTSMNNLLAAGERAGVRHQVILSIVGVDQVPQLVYYRAKTLQEDLLRQGPTPYSIVRATQFFEFMNTLVSETSDDTTVRLPATRLQPIASADVAAAVAEVSTGTPLRGIWNVACPESSPSTNSAGPPWPHSRTAGPSSPTTRPALRGRHRRRAHRRPGRTPGADALPGLDPPGPGNRQPSQPATRSGPWTGVWNSSGTNAHPTVKKNPGMASNAVQGFRSVVRRS